MESCVIYARVSTKEQQAEGYSIPAQLKAIRAFSEAQGLSPVSEFIEAESAGKAGRKRFSEMVAFLKANPEVKTVVAHKLDRLYRNFKDQIILDDLGIRARFVVGDIPNTPQGELLRDVNLSVAKFYLGNLREEVKKGMDEKIAQGGWPHKAPIGYANDKNTRSLVVDRTGAKLVRHAFERYATGEVSLSMLCDELEGKGLTTRTGKRISPSALQAILKNPIYCGQMRYKGNLYQGTHQPLITAELFDLVQTRFAPRATGPKRTKHTFVLRDFLVCAECGCKITAEHQKGYNYYRCTHGKGRDACGQRSYTREELLMQQLDAVFSEIEIGPEIIAALVKDSLLLDKQTNEESDEERALAASSIEELDSKSSKLLDAYLDGAVPVEAYTAKAAEIAQQRKGFERRLAALADTRQNVTAQVEAQAKLAASARFRFAEADDQGKRRILSELLLNAEVQDKEIASIQLKSPFEYLRRDPEGAFRYEWWAILDLNQ